MDSSVKHERLDSYGIFSPIHISTTSGSVGGDFRLNQEPKNVDLTNIKMDLMFELRKINSTYNGLNFSINVYEDDQKTELIFFIDNLIDEPAPLSFVSTKNGKTWSCNDEIDSLENLLRKYYYNLIFDN